MGWCHEFGTQVHLGCDHPMTAGSDSCHCDECGFVCTGKFVGCPDVWARGPRPVALVRPPEPPKRKLPGLDSYVAPSEEEEGHPTEDAAEGPPQDDAGLPPAVAGWSPSTSASRPPPATPFALSKGLERLIDRAPPHWKSRLNRLTRGEQPKPWNPSPRPAWQEAAPSDSEPAEAQPATAELATAELATAESTRTAEPATTAQAEIPGPVVGAAAGSASSSPDTTAWQPGDFPESPVAAEPERAISATPAEETVPWESPEIESAVPERPHAIVAPEWEEAWPADEAEVAASIHETVQTDLAAGLAHIREELIHSFDEALRQMRQEMVTAVGEVAAAARSEMLGSVETSLAAARGEMLGSVEDSLVAARSDMRSSADDALTAARDEMRSWLDEAVAAVRGEMRSLLNDAVGALRSDIDRMDSDVREQRMGSAGVSELAETAERLMHLADALPPRLDRLESDLGRLESDITGQQSAIHDLAEAAGTTTRLVQLVEDLQLGLAADAASRAPVGTEQASRKLDETMEEARSVLAGMQLAAAAVKAELEQLTELREHLVRETAGQVDAANAVSVPPVVLEELAETARAGQKLGELVDDLPALIAESVADVLDAELVEEPQRIAPPEPIFERPEPLFEPADADLTSSADADLTSSDDVAAPDERAPQGDVAASVVEPDALPPILRPDSPEEPPAATVPPRQAPPPAPPPPRSPLRRFRSRKQVAPPDISSTGRRAHRRAAPADATSGPPLPWEPGQAPPPSLIEDRPAPVDVSATAIPPAVPDDSFDVEAPLDLPITDAQAARVSETAAGEATEWPLAPDELEFAPEPSAAGAEPRADEAEPEAEAEAGEVVPRAEEAEPEAEPETGEAEREATDVDLTAREETIEPAGTDEAPELGEPDAQQAEATAALDEADEAALPVREEPGAEPEEESEVEETVAAPFEEPGAAVAEEPESEPPARPTIDLEPATKPEPATTNGGSVATAPRPSRRSVTPPTPAPAGKAPRYRAKTLNRLADTWEGIVRQFMEGGATRTPEIEPWFAAYDGEVHYDAVPEPFVGSLASRPKAVILSLNPGPAFAHLHARDGHFINEIKRSGSYAAWAAEGPDSELPYGRKSTNASRIRFLEGWLEPEPVEPGDVVTFEMYPWPATTWTGRIDLNPIVLELVDRYIIEPVAALRPPCVFAFGVEWFRALDGLGFAERVTVGGEHGPTWAGAAPSRVVTVFEHERKRLRVVAMRHRGSPGPPKPAEVGPLRDLLARTFKDEPASRQKGRARARSSTS